MVAEVLLSVWLTQACIITGEVTWSAEHTTAHLRASCPIRYQVDGARIRLTSKRWIVDIPVPEESGVQAFSYRWGQSEASVGEHTVKIS